MKISAQQFILPLIANVLLFPCIGCAWTEELMAETANTITVTKFHQSYPYSGKAMVEYTVSGLVPTNAIAEFTLNSCDTSATFIQKDIVAGENLFTIDFASSFGGTKLLTNATFEVSIRDETPIKGKWLHTPWNEVEVGMALMRGLPVLLVKDKEIDSGIFDSKLSEAFIATVSSDFDSRKIEANKDLLVGKVR